MALRALCLVAALAAVAEAGLWCDATTSVVYKVRGAAVAVERPRRT